MNILDNIKAMREKAKQAETKYYSTTNGKYLNPGNMKEGKTVLRIAPGKGGTLPFVPFRSTYLEVELEIDKLSRYYLEKVIEERGLKKQLKVEDLSDWDDEKLRKHLKTILGESYQYKTNKKVFIATVHGKEGSKDLVEEYIKFAVTKFNAEMSRDEAKKKLNPIFGYRDKGKWIGGLNPSTSFVAKAWDWEDKEFYQLEIYGKHMDRIEQLYIKFDDSEEPLTIDPFTNAETGIGIQFDKTKNEKGGWDFAIDDVPFNYKKYKSYDDFQASFALTEEQIKMIDEVDSLESEFGRGSFKKSDFEIQLSGLILFDTKHDYNIFENDEFLEIVEELSLQQEDDAEEDQKSGKDIEKAFAKKTLKVKKVVPEPEPEEEDEYDEEVEENIVKSTTTNASVALQDKLAALRKNLGKK